MNTTSRAILQTVIASDAALSGDERNALQRLVNGETEVPTAVGNVSEHLFVTQKKAAELLSVSRVTVWRMTKDSLLHPVEILPGTWRYPYQEIAAFGRAAAPAAAPASRASAA